jgi:hypothetical protein
VKSPFAVRTIMLMTMIIIIIIIIIIAVASTILVYQDAALTALTLGKHLPVTLISVSQS